MQFIPQEIKEKLAELEKENARLRAENNQLERDQALEQESAKTKPMVWVIIVLLVFAIIYIVYQQFVVIPKIQANAQPEVESPEAVMIRDGKIEKWNRIDDGSLVYRVQMGAFETFDLDKYKQNIEGLYQDSIDGYHKVSLGAFTRLADAQRFQGSLVRMGMGNVYIVAYENNKPIGLIEAKSKEPED